MANTIATATGYDKSRMKETHRLGSEEASAQVATYHTFCNTSIKKDGSGYVSVRQNGKEIFYFRWGPEKDAPI